MRSLLISSILSISIPTLVFGQTYTEAAHLHGVHFGADMNANGIQTSGPYYSDVEDLFLDGGGPVGSGNVQGQGGGWLLETVQTDVNDVNNDESDNYFNWAWQGAWLGTSGLDKTKPGWMYYQIAKSTAFGKNSSPIVRLHPAYGRNVPYDTTFFPSLAGPSDPYSVANYTSDVTAVVTLLSNVARYYVVGNEVNLPAENNRFTSTAGGLNTYSTTWNPTPENYADVYLAVRDAIHAAPTGSAGTPVALIQPVSPGTGNATPYRDGNEFLWRQIKRVNSADPGKLDGFAIHAYAEPGGGNFGVDGFMDAIREQLCIISQLGHHNKPVFLTEFNKDMPDAANHLIGVDFVKKAYLELNQWNQNVAGALIPGLNNQNIVGTNWFVYPAAGGGALDGWNRYSLGYWKANAAGSTANDNVWYAFQHVANQRYPRGAYGGGSAWPGASDFWWSDEFNGNTLDQFSGLPDWHVDTTDSGSYSVGSGKISFKGNSTPVGGATILSRGYVFGDFALETKITFTNAAQAVPGAGAGTSPESNFDLRLREGHTGYSLTFFSSQSPDRPGRIVLRRTGAWTTIGSTPFDASVSGGINTGDSFVIRVVADGSNISYRVYKNNGTTAVASFDVNSVNDTDSSGLGPRNVGWARAGTYGINQVDMDYIRMGGKDANLAAFAGAEKSWELYD